MVLVSLGRHLHQLLLGEFQVSAQLLDDLLAALELSPHLRQLIFVHCCFKLSFMDNLSLSAISRPAATITGSIFIKRKMFWAERYARIKDRKLAYYEDKADSVPRAVLHLANAELVEGVNGRDDLYELRLRSGPVQSLFIKIENKSFRQRFIGCLQ